MHVNEPGTVKAAINAHLAFYIFPPSVLKILPFPHGSIGELPRLQCSWVDMKIAANSHQNMSLSKLKRKIGSGGN